MLDRRAAQAAQPRRSTRWGDSARFLIALAGTIMPWTLRRRFLGLTLGYRLHPGARIGLSLVAPAELELADGARIGHLNVFRGLQSVSLGPNALVGNLNYVTGEPPRRRDGLYERHLDRRPELVLAESAAITNRHLIDCTDSVSLGRFALVAGWRSTIISHAFDIRAGVQTCGPIRIGEYAVVSTNCVLLAGSSLPPNSVLGAMSLLRDELSEPYRLYAGNPARPVGEYEPEAAFFNRVRGPLS